MNGQGNGLKKLSSKDSGLKWCHPIQIFIKERGAEIFSEFLPRPSISNSRLPSICRGAPAIHIYVCIYMGQTQGTTLYTYNNIEQQVAFNELTIHQVLSRRGFKLMSFRSGVRSSYRRSSQSVEIIWISASFSTYSSSLQFFAYCIWVWIREVASALASVFRQVSLPLPAMCQAASFPQLDRQCSMSGRTYNVRVTSDEEMIQSAQNV